MPSCNHTLLLKITVLTYTQNATAPVPCIVSQNTFITGHMERIGTFDFGSALPRSIADFTATTCSLTTFSQTWSFWKYCGSRPRIPRYSKMIFQGMMMPVQLHIVCVVNFFVNGMKDTRMWCMWEQWLEALIFVCGFLQNDSNLLCITIVPTEKLLENVEERRRNT